MNKKTFIKPAIITLLIITAILGLILFFTNGFTVGKITNKVYNVQNVYDEIWNLMIREGRGEKTVLTDFSPSAETTFEFGDFDYINIPECKTNLSFSSGKLNIIVRAGESFTENITEKNAKNMFLTYMIRKQRYCL